MLIIRQAQVFALGDAMQRRFELQMLSHLRSSFTSRANAYSHDELIALIRGSIARARGYAITLESDVSRFLEYALIYGADFDSTPRFRPAAEILRSANITGTEKMDRLDEYDEFAR